VVTPSTSVCQSVWTPLFPSDFRPSYPPFRLDTLSVNQAAIPLVLPSHWSAGLSIRTSKSPIRLVNLAVNQGGPPILAHRIRVLDASLPTRRLRVPLISVSDWMGTMSIRLRYRLFLLHGIPSSCSAPPSKSWSPIGLTGHQSPTENAYAPAPAPCHACQSPAQRPIRIGQPRCQSPGRNTQYPAPSPPVNHPLQHPITIGQHCCQSRAGNYN